MTYVEVEQPEKTVEHDDVDAPAEHEIPTAPTDTPDEPTDTPARGRSAARTADFTRDKLIGGLSVAAIAVGGLHQAAGIPGLIAGGAAVTASGAAYVAHRYRRTGRGRARREGRTSTASPSTSGSRRSKAAKGSGVFPSLGLGGRGGGGKRRRGGLPFGGGDGGGKRPKRSRRDKNHGGGDGTASTPKASRAFLRAARKRGAQALGAALTTGRWADATSKRLARARARLDVWQVDLLRALVAKVRRWWRRTDAPDTAEKKAESPEATETTPEAGPGPDAPETADKPRTRPLPRQPRHRERTTTMSSGNPLIVVSAELIPAAAGWATEDMMILASGMDNFGQWPAHNATALRTFTTRLAEDYPLHPVIIESLHKLWVAQSSLIQPAQEIGALLRRVHAGDIARREKPRRREDKWNVV
ncbi:hypothetical protein [Planomonospora sp. ID82291]|uniref:hypothetical protein n=1 Tax=Planomonospora sp. ID82291 TaxID=2738136 RepID=UPI0018C359F3|nr:hypothetical protein [Planomonospora sp. ID82291]MBG0818998.1 hypothetical protein [Planomonospora sp. ID82291]